MAGRLPTHLWLLRPGVLVRAVRDGGGHHLRRDSKGPAESGVPSPRCPF